MLNNFAYVIGVDFGGTQLRAVLADSEGRFLKRISQPTEASRGREHVINNIVNLVEEILNGIDRAQVAGIGLGAPAPLNPETGIVFQATGLPDWGDFPLRDVLIARLHLPLIIANDANLAALGEYRFGAGKGYHYLVYLTISTGVGAGVIEQGRILLGASGLAAELGHLTLEMNGPRCSCGNVGCLAMYVCGGAIKNRALEQLEAGRESLLRDKCEGDLTRLTSAMVAEAAYEGDAFALEHLRQTGRYLGAGVVTALHTFNPEVIVIGGGVSQIGRLLFDPMHEWVATYAMPALQAPVLPSQLGDDAGLYGAVALALSQVPSA